MTNPHWMLDATPEEVAAYELGAKHAETLAAAHASHAERVTRIAAFAAIRRAVIIAHMYESLWPERAHAIRHAIRAAIGSDET